MNFLQYLRHGGLLQAPEDERALGLFWGSSFGVERSTGRPNVKDGERLTRLRNPEDWVPVQILEPLLWGAGLLKTRRNLP